jgi:hypothetical protein
MSWCGVHRLSAHLRIMHPRIHEFLRFMAVGLCPAPGVQKGWGSIPDPPDFDAYIPPEERRVLNSIYLSIDSITTPLHLSVRLKLRGFHSQLIPHYYYLPSRNALLPASAHHHRVLAQQLDFRRVSVHPIDVVCCSLVFSEHAQPQAIREPPFPQHPWPAYAAHQRCR